MVNTTLSRYSATAETPLHLNRRRGAGSVRDDDDDGYDGEEKDKGGNRKEVLLDVEAGEREGSSE